MRAEEVRLAQTVLDELARHAGVVEAGGEDHHLGLFRDERRR
jgi:hypothetical protein